MLTQEVFGRAVEIIARRDNWVRCRLTDGYEGWMAEGAVCEDPGMPAPGHVVTRRFARARSETPGDLMLPLGSHLAVQDDGEASLDVSLPGGGCARVVADSICPLGSLPWDIGRFGELTRELVGTPYLWGGKSTFGIDCSGLVQAMFEFFGYDLPRDSRKQALQGDMVADLSGVIPLDLIFFGDAERIDHVGVHLGDLSMLHASGHVRVESLDPASGSFRPDLLDRYRFARRFIHD
jgi:hypothetical protein